MIEELLKNNKKAIGVKQVAKAIERHLASTVFIALDSDEKVTRSLKELCKANNHEIIEVESMKLLGKYSGIDVGASVVCLLK